MHAISHSLAHRGPGASRARSRWQPYNALNQPSSVQTRSPQSYLHTPVSTILSASPATYISPACHLDVPRKCAPVPALQSSQGCSLRDVHKNKHVTRLVDQAVKSLCDIWQPEDIPTAFRMSSSTSASPLSACEKTSAPAEVPLMQLHMRNPQLLSPVSPSTHNSPLYSPATSSTAVPSGCTRADHLLPIRGFVHEVLRRSRTSTGVLQTALCYLEAIRMKVPTILEKEKLKEACPDAYMEEPVDRIVLGTDLEGEDLVAPESSLPTARNSSCDDIGMSTAAMCVVDGLLTAPSTEIIAADDTEIVAPPPLCATTSKTPSPPLPPLPPQPSPLLCPRRTFLACLILASKFMQDRSYSNKAWAKLAGLPPREIGRCERALGEALEWRLWVGKGPSTSTSTPTAHRAVARCKTELVISRSPTCAWPTPTTPAALYTSHVSAVRAPNRGLSNLRRAATMPDLESSGFGNDGLGFCLPDAPPSTAVVYTTEATLVAEPDMDEFDGAGQVPPAAAWSAPSIQASLYAGEVASPSLSTPGLAYSPMSTSSSDDGDRVFAGKPSSHAAAAADCSPYTFGDLAHYAGGAPSYSNSMPSRLAPPSDAVFNPVLIERMVAHPVGLHPSYSFGVASHSYASSVNWSMSGAH